MDRLKVNGIRNGNINRESMRMESADRTITKERHIGGGILWNRLNRAIEWNRYHVIIEVMNGHPWVGEDQWKGIETMDII